MISRAAKRGQDGRDSCDSLVYDPYAQNLLLMNGDPYGEDSLGTWSYGPLIPTP